MEEHTIITVGVDVTDHCDSCGGNGNHSSNRGVLFNPGKPSLAADTDENRRNFVVCDACLVRALRVLCQGEFLRDYPGATGSIAVLPVITDDLGTLVWYAQNDDVKALYLDNGTGGYPGKKLADLPMRGAKKAPIV